MTTSEALAASAAVAIGTGAAGIMYGTYLATYWANLIDKYIKQYKPTFDRTGRAKPTTATNDEVGKRYNKLNDAVASAKNFTVTRNLIEFAIKIMVMDAWLTRLKLCNMYTFGMYNEIKETYFRDYWIKILNAINLVKDDLIATNLSNEQLAAVVWFPKKINANTNISSDLTDDEKYVLFRVIASKGILAYVTHSSKGIPWNASVYASSRNTYSLKENDEEYSIPYQEVKVQV